MTISNAYIVDNVRIVTPTGVIENGWLAVKDGLIQAIGKHGEALPAEHGERVDGKGGWLLPGFIDVHVHGGNGYDFMDADSEGLEAIARFHTSHGTTSLLATTVTASKEQLDGVLERVSRYVEQPKPHARLLGVHLEGPFISAKWPGAQNPAHISAPRLDWLSEWTERYPGLIRMQTLAPEQDGALPYIEALCRHGIVAACGHTDAAYAQLTAAADSGLTHAVHTYNAMKPLHHREPGTVGAVLTDDRITAEVIADGHHVHPAAIKLLVRQKGADRVVLITDAISAAGLGDGRYELGGLPVIVQDGVARLADGSSLAGSTLTMIRALQFVVRHAGVSVEDASRMASGNPARVAGVDKTTGSLSAGKRADLVLLDDALELAQVWVGGNRIQNG